MAKVFREKIEHFNESLKPYYTLIIMIIFFVGLFITSYKILVKSPKLSVFVSKENINYPNSINENYSKVYDSFMKGNPDSDLKVEANTVYSYLLKTKQNWIIRLKNETDKTVEKVNLRIINVSDITSWAVSSDYLLEEEKKEVLDKVKFQKSSGVVYLSDFVNIPPNSSMSLYLWGKFDESPWNDNIIVTYDGGVGIIEKRIEVTGFKAYLVDYCSEIMFFLLLLFCLVSLYTIRGKLNEAPNAKKDTGINS